MESTNPEELIDLTEQIQRATALLDNALSVLCEDSYTKNNPLAKIAERIGIVKSRLLSVPDLDSHSMSSTIDSCARILDDAIRLAKKAPVVPLRQAQFMQSLYRIQSLLDPLYRQ